MVSGLGHAGHAGTTPAALAAQDVGGGGGAPTQKDVSQGCGMVGGAAGGAVEGAAKVPGNDLTSVLKGLTEVIDRLIQVLDREATGGGKGAAEPKQAKSDAGDVGGAGGAAEPKKAKQDEEDDDAKGAKGGGGGGCGCGGGGAEAAPTQSAVKAARGDAAPIDYVAPAITTVAPTTSSEDDAFEQRVLDLVNQERGRAGLRPLTYNGVLDRAAEKHNGQQARTGKMAHDGIGDGTPGERIRGEGFRNSWGENVAVGQRSAEQVVREWMASPGHRANILNPNFNQLGVSYQVSANGTPFWAQEFGA